MLHIVLVFNEQNVLVAERPLGRPWQTSLFRVPLGVDVQPAAQAEVGRKTDVQWDSRGLTQQAGPQGQERRRTG